MAESLKQKTVKGLGWSALDNAARYGMQFVIGIVLARLLSPDDYGLLGLVGIVTVVSTALVNGGFTTALIRKKDATDDDFNTAFICNLCMSLLLFAAVFFCAPLVADFFGRVELTALVRVASLGLIVGALGIVPQTRLTKRIDFKTQTKITIAATALSGIIGIGMALTGFGVWSLVAQQLTSQAVTTIMLYVYNSSAEANFSLFTLHFSLKSFHDLFGFGWKMMLSGVLDSVWKESYQMVVGKVYTPGALGQYTRAKQFSSLFSSNLTAVIQRVTYPVLSNIQDDRQRMVSAYRRIIKVTMFVTATGMFFLAAVSEPMLYCLIGPKWHEASTYLPLICLNSALYPLHAINLNMLQVQGRSDLFLGLEVVKKLIGLIPLAVCVFWGIMPMLYVNLAVGVVAYFLNSHYSGRLIGYSSWMQVKDIAPSCLVAAIVAVSVYFVKYIPASYWVILPLQIIMGAVVFMVLCQLTRNPEYIEMKTMFTVYKSPPAPPEGGNPTHKPPFRGDRGAFKWMVCTRCVTFNQAPYIVDAMNGFTMQQTTFPFVCTIIDDASTDGEPEVIRQYLQEHFDLEDKSVVLNEETDDYVLCFARHKENRNCHFAVLWLKYNHHSRHKSIMPYIAKWKEISKYYALCEGDDYWTSPQKLQRQVLFLEQHDDYVMSYSQAAVRSGDDIVGLRKFKTCDFESIVCFNGITTLTVLFREELRERFGDEIRPIAPGSWLMGDYPIWLYLSLKGKIHYIAEPLGVYRLQPESTSHSKDFQKSLRFAESVCQVRQFFLQYAERLTGTQNPGLRKKVAEENMKRILSVYFSFHKTREAKSYLKEHGGELSFLSLLLMRLRIIKHSITRR